MLLVHADDTEPRHWREHGRAGADDDRRFAACDARALVAPLRLGQRRMQDCDALAETRPEATDGLWRERDFGNEHDRAAPALDRGGAGLEIDLGLPAARGTEEEEVGSLARLECADDAIEGRTLCVAELGRLGLTGQPVAGRRLRPLAAGLALHRRDERERAAGRRAVVVRDPERQLDERFRQLLDDTLDLGGLDALRGRDVDLRHDTASLRVAEAHFDDRAGPDLVPDLVGELACERARRYEGIDGGIAGHYPSLEPGCDS